MVSKNSFSNEREKGIFMKLMSGMYQLYKKVCRAYAWYIMGDKPADIIMCFLSSIQFWKIHRHWPNFKNPNSFSEKVWNRMLFDRDPRWIIFSDKLRVREYIAKAVGHDHLIPLLWSGKNPEKIPFKELPQKFVIKANHGCGYNIIVNDKGQLDENKIRMQLSEWLKQNYCRDLFLGVEWGYKNIKPSIIVETFLEDNCAIPIDYKFFCYSGRVEFVQLDFDRFTDHSEKFFDRDFNPLDNQLGIDIKQYRGNIVRPNNYEEMVQVAESLTDKINFIRVDLYSVGNKIYVGELTCFPGAGSSKFIPNKNDYLFGEKWNMK